MTTDETPLMRKIRLLMAKAAGTNNEHEAASFAAKVQELLLQNGLSASDIRSADAGQKAEQVAEHDSVNAKSFLKSPARKVLLHAVARFYMCQTLRWGNERLVFVGKRANAEVAGEMMEYLLSTTLRLSNTYAVGKGNAARIDYRKGCMLRLAERLNELRTQRESEAKQPAAGGSNLPVLFVGESQLVQQYMNSLNLRRGRPLRVKEGLHAAEGRRGANGISLAPQVGQGAKQRAIR